MGATTGLQAGEEVDPALLQQQRKVKGDARAKETQDGLTKLNEAGAKSLADINQSGEANANKLLQKVTATQDKAAQRAAHTQLRDTELANAAGNGPAELTARMKYWWLDEDFSLLIPKARILPVSMKMDANEAKNLPAGMYRLGPAGQYAFKLLDGPNSPLITLPEHPDTAGQRRTVERMLAARGRQAASQQAEQQAATYPLSYSL